MRCIDSMILHRMLLNDNGSYIQGEAVFSKSPFDNQSVRNYWLVYFPGKFIEKRLKLYIGYMD